MLWVVIYFVIPQIIYISAQVLLLPRTQKLNNMWISFIDFVVNIDLTTKCQVLMLLLVLLFFMTFLEVVITKYSKYSIFIEFYLIFFSCNSTYLGFTATNRSWPYGTRFIEPC